MPRSLLFFVCMLMLSQQIGAQQVSYVSCEQVPYLKKKRRAYVGPHLARFFSEAVQDVFALHINLLTWDSFKVITTVFPFFIATRMIDDKLQRCFYDEKHHRNKNQMPQWCHDVAQWGIAVPSILLGLNAIFAQDPEFRLTSKLFIIGIPFVIWGKDLIKNIEFDACFRPWNEHFSCVKRSGGGFPSGHMAEAAYMAVLYGSRFGPKIAIPLSVLAGFIGVTFLTCNRHYTSQLVAGTGFGALYALAANRLIDEKLAAWGVRLDYCNGPQLSISFNF